MLKIILLLIFASFAASEVAINPFIVGGQDARPGQFPYMVSLRPVVSPINHFCGAGIISPQWILSAAHCFIFIRRPEEILAIVGSVTLSSGGTTYNIDRLINHPRFIPNIPSVYTSNWYDIALLRTDRQIIFSQLVQPIPLGRRFVIGNVNATVAGFGVYDPNVDLDRPTTLENTTTAENLQFLDNVIITQSECGQRVALAMLRYPNTIIRPIIHPTIHLCTIQPRGTGVCFGDSGSMLISNGQAVGVVIGGVRICAQSAFTPDTFTRISTFIPWIESFVNDFE